MPIRCEYQPPSLPVHRSVMVTAEGEKIPEISAPPVAPPLNVVQHAQCELDRAAGNSACRVEGKQGPSLRIVGDTGTPTEVERTTSGDATLAIDRNRAEASPSSFEKISDFVNRDLTRSGPGGVTVHHDHHLGS